MEDGGEEGSCKHRNYLKFIKRAVRFPDIHPYPAQPGDYLPQNPQEREIKITRETKPENLGLGTPDTE